MTASSKRKLSDAHRAYLMELLRRVGNALTNSELADLLNARIGIRLSNQAISHHRRKLHAA